jgi:hypothetical protein
MAKNDDDEGGFSISYIFILLCVFYTSDHLADKIITRIKNPTTVVQTIVVGDTTAVDDTISKQVEKKPDPNILRNMGFLALIGVVILIIIKIS